MKIGIFGRTQALDKKIIEKAKDIGKIIASKKHTVITGGTDGYPHIVALSAIDAGGRVMSYATGMSMVDHLKFHKTDLSKYGKIIFQKKYCNNKKLTDVDNYLRSLDMCLNVDMAIIIGGRVGTMYEVTILSGIAKDMLVLEGSGGITGQTIKKFIKEGHKGNSKIRYFKDLEALKKII